MGRNDRRIVAHRDAGGVDHKAKANFRHSQAIMGVIRFRGRLLKAECAVHDETDHSHTVTPSGVDGEA
jgi:hypothetical protein